MKANSIPLKKLFEQTIRYRIPLFQRPYVWKEKDNWKPLWDDIHALAERVVGHDAPRPHFLGAIVLDQLQGPVGEIEVRQVIDGQQRLTTLQIMMAALRDLSAARGAEKYSKRFEKFTSNDESFVDSEEDRFKVWPTNRDREDYRQTLTAGSPKAVRRRFKARANARRVGSRIPDAYLFFHQVFQEWLEEIPDEVQEGADVEAGDRLEALWNVIQGSLLLVAIDLEQDDDAQVIFETLNARGTRLLPADLVKNYLFHMAELEEAPLEALYEKHWSRFDKDDWRREEKQGRLKRPRIDLFLQHFLTLKTLDDVAVSHIFEAFQRYAKSSGSPTGAEGHLKVLTRYGDFFAAFRSPPEESRPELFFERLEAIDTATVYPFLLEAYAVLGADSEQLDRILVDLESFLVRRMVCGLTTKNYNRYFLDLVRDAEKRGGITPEGVHEFLSAQSGDSVRWPGDEELERAWMEQPFYGRLSQPKQRMILQAIDREMETNKNESIKLRSKLTIEHLLPQQWEAHWPLALSDPEDELERQEKTERRNRLLHTVGNLTLLTGPLNTSVSNSPWEKRQPEIMKHSKLNLSRRLHGVGDWNEEQILKRGKELLGYALAAWPGPTGR